MGDRLKFLFAYKSGVQDSLVRHRLPRRENETDRIGVSVHDRFRVNILARRYGWIIANQKLCSLLQNSGGSLSVVSNEKYRVRKTLIRRQHIPHYAQERLLNPVSCLVPFN